MSMSTEEISDENGSASDGRPSSPRTAPVGKDNEMCRAVSVSRTEALHCLTSIYILLNSRVNSRSHAPCCHVSFMLFYNFYHYHMAVTKSKTSVTYI